MVSPLAQMLVNMERVRQSVHFQINDLVPTLCEDCRECYLLVIRRKAARRAREKRKAEEVRQHESLALAQESESQYSSQQDRKRKQPCTSITEQKGGQLLSKT